MKSKKIKITSHVLGLRSTALLLGILFLLPWQCVDPYTPNLKDHDKLLVIEGTITNAPGPYTVKISTTIGIDYPFQQPLEGAIVILYEQGGEQEQLVETEAGTYLTSDAGIRGEVGKFYRISITTPEGQEYESGDEELLPFEPIDSVYAEFERRTDPDYAYDLKGYQFFVDASIQHEENDFFLWKLTETYKFHSDLMIPFYYAGQILPFPKPDSLYTCYKTSEVKDIYVFDAERLQNPQIRRFPFHYVDTEDRRLFLRYSLLVRQYAVSQEAFEFWNQIKKQNSGLGALYTTQPFQIRGNIHNVNDPEEAVLGYFMAAGYSEQRIFVGPPPGAEFHFGVCQIGEPEIYDMRSLPRTRPSTWPIYLGESPGGALGLPDQICVDCRLKNATIEKPDFWID